MASYSNYYQTYKYHIKEISSYGQSVCSDTICGEPAYYCMWSMQVVDVIPMKYHFSSITSIRVVQQKHHSSKVCL
jgi:hypothetical protein